ncbi:MAG: DUF2203 family protein [Planctomycetes bacterium]|nr:DUF2203 family protein [Planctomycetota bacterium]
MPYKSFARFEAERLLPLVRAIGREIEERNRVLAALERRMATLSIDQLEQRAELARLECQVSTVRRELRRAEKEITALGCRLDIDHPLRVLFPGRGETFAWEGPLGRTTFYRRVEERAAG